MPKLKIGEKIQGLRTSRGMTQKELATFLGCSESFISYVEKGDRNFSVEDLNKICKIFSVDINFFIEKPNIAHFRAGQNKKDDNPDYDDMVDNFLAFITSKK